MEDSASDEAKPQPVIKPSASVQLPPGMVRVLVDDALTLIEAARGAAVVDFFEDDSGSLRTRIRGEWVPCGAALKAEFCAFVAAGRAQPRCQYAPWSAVYTGEGNENDAFDITAAEFTAFAAAFGIAVRHGADASVPQPLDCPTTTGERGMPEPPADRGRRMKRAALIADNLRRWPTIERDLKDAASNGLSKAARDDTAVGWWWEGLAVNWAQARSKLRDASPGVAGMIHRMQR